LPQKLLAPPSSPLFPYTTLFRSCRMNAADRICADLERRVGRPGVPAGDGRFTWVRSPCLGQCDRAPAAFVQTSGPDAHDWSMTHVTVDDVVRTTGPVARRKPHVDRDHGGPDALDGPDTTFGIGELRLLRRIGVVDPESLDDYRAHGGYTALRRALALGPEGVIREVLDSRLVGRGGAAFPAGRKWQAVAHAPARPHYVVCNADESEPGTFKDRVLMESDPFALIEAMTIAGFATACERGFIYIRGEYPLATARLAQAIETCRRRGLLGPDVLAESISFDIELRRGAGAYICGEETALFSSIEGY